MNINLTDISKKSLRLNKIETDIPIYDKYSLTFTLNNGEVKRILLYADKGSIDKGVPIEDNVKQFFMNFLIKGEAIKNNKVYLGRFNPNNDGKPINDRFSLSYTGQENKQQLFDSLIESLGYYENGEITIQDLIEDFTEVFSLFEFYEESNLTKQEIEDMRNNLHLLLTKALEPNMILSKSQDKSEERHETCPKSFKENIKLDKEIPVIKQGKHYALGDVHGNKEAYDTAMNQLGENDSIIVLGDVIDRGNNGIEILLDLIRRQANTGNSNIRFIMGNHELMLLDYINLVNKHNLQPDEIDEINRFGKLKRRVDNLCKVKNDKSLDRSDREEAYKLGLEILNSKQWQGFMSKYSNLQIEKISDYLSSMNGGDKTISKYNELSEDMKNEIQKFLSEAYIVYNQTIQNQNKLYVHARPPKEIDIIKALKGKNDTGIRYSEMSRINKEVCYFSTWNRTIDTFTICKREGFTTICGHEPQLNTSIIDRNRGFICLDEGCGHGNIYTAGLYCIEDGTILHINELGKIDNKNGKIKVINEDKNEQIVISDKIPQDKNMEI